MSSEVTTVLRASSAGHLARHVGGVGGVSPAGSLWPALQSWWLAICCFRPMLAAPPKMGPGSLAAAVKADARVPEHLKPILHVES